ncbi:MAG: SusD/RagB family nutrient-binding outer membrane lipoprotein [Saprospiraceae bacterium]|nr:SusD/RagB family nutrient-binding outer membrane lipoprotein [Saprospiraceae bacterium]
MNLFKNKHILATIFFLSIFISSCDNYLDVNVDPNQSSTSDINLQLTSGQLYTAIGFGERLFPIIGIWCQYQTGGPGVSLGDPDQHILSSSEGNQIFRSVYRAANNFNYIIKNAPEEKFYVAIAKIMKAYGIQTCVDLFGDIPYTEALKGDISDGSILHPKYDNAKDVIYPALAAELIEAAKILHDGGAFRKPGTDDLVFGGDLAKWEKFANSLLLKLYLRQGATQKVKDLVAADPPFISANADAAKVNFPGGSTGSNPFWTAAKSTALGNFYVATTTTLDYLESTNDPRIDYFYDRNDAGDHKGINPGDVENAPTSSATLSKPAGALKKEGGLIFSPTAPVVFMTAWESHLLLAEAAVLGAAGDAKASYEAAVKANFAALGVTAGADATYLAGKGAYDAANPMKSIGLQKWVCMNGTQPIESWIETRRMDNAGNPIFTSTGGIFKSPTKNALGNGIYPSIMPYPEIEESLNQSFIGQHALTAKVFWDN